MQFYLQKIYVDILQGEFKLLPRMYGIREGDKSMCVVTASVHVVALLQFYLLPALQNAFDVN